MVQPMVEGSTSVLSPLSHLDTLATWAMAHEWVIVLCTCMSQGRTPATCTYVVTCAYVHPVPV